ncbi:hypothetical protein [Anaerocolumna jejuensis]|uniref:hypothetical protein n=1 Tax=Anaerocolumna jejuensis TaxID=259063 RepID=UPI003F7C44A1
MSIIKKISVFTMLLFMSVLALAPMHVNAATTGQQLTSPEAGWQRFNDSNNLIKFTNFNFAHTSQSGNFNGDLSYSTNSNSKVEFSFYGTKLRIIGQYNTTTYRSDGLVITIDDVPYYYNELGNSMLSQIVEFEKSNLEARIHNVTITRKTSDTKFMTFDAVDIDDSGYLVSINTPAKLTATADDSKIILTWEAKEGVSSYNLKRSTTTGGPYETIATGSSISYTDNNVIPGTTYYYVVSAIVSGIESSNSNEVSATPSAVTNPDYIGNYATLVITMTNGGIKEYTLPVTEIDKFITWYDKKSDGKGKSYYTFTKASSVSPYLRIKEYISFEKITNFDLKEFNQ